MKTFFPLRHRLKSSISYIFCKQHFLSCSTFVFGCTFFNFILKPSMPAKLIFLQSLLPFKCNKKWATVILFKVSYNFIIGFFLSYSEKKCVSKPKNTYYSKQFFWNNIVLIFRYQEFLQYRLILNYPHCNFNTFYIAYKRNL